MLSVLNVAFPFAPVGPDTVGGAEQILSQIDRALVRVGHRSFVIALEGSHVAGTLIPVPVPEGPLDAGTRRRAHGRHREAIMEAVVRHRIDVVHLHGIDFFAYLPPPGVPVLVTLHLPLSWYPLEALAPERPDTWLHGVSVSQQRGMVENAHLLPPVENGVAVEDLAGFCHAKRRFALALGRICPEKGYHLALEAAHAAGAPLLIGGQIYPYEAHRRYFDEDVAPKLDRLRRFLGPLGFVRKRRLAAAARCLLVPSLAPETSSLVAMEALACGTPVVAFPNGALADIVEHGRTGFLVHDAREMADAIGEADGIDPARCRDAAFARFSLRQSMERYLALYGRLAGP